MEDNADKQDNNEREAILKDKVESISAKVYKQVFEFNPFTEELQYEAEGRANRIKCETIALFRDDEGVIGFFGSYNDGMLADFAGMIGVVEMDESFVDLAKEKPVIASTKMMMIIRRYGAAKSDSDVGVIYKKIPFREAEFTNMDGDLKKQLETIERMEKLIDEGKEPEIVFKDVKKHSPLRP